jgi:hypothetical protein
VKRGAAVGMNVANMNPIPKRDRDSMVILALVGFICCSGGNMMVFGDTGKVSVEYC